MYHRAKAASPQNLRKLDEVPEGNPALLLFVMLLIGFLCWQGVLFENDDGGGGGHGGAGGYE